MRIDIKQRKEKKTKKMDETKIAFTSLCWSSLQHLLAILLITTTLQTFELLQWLIVEWESCLRLFIDRAKFQDKKNWCHLN
jgi:hypothetical protein